MKKKKEAKKDEVIGKLLSMTILCPILNKEVSVTDFYINSSESECETCGSHGEVSVSVLKCECNKIHDIQIRSW